MTKEKLLFLCHRIPFPPNKGDKIRSFNILKKLSEHYEVYLGCFIDDPFDKQYVGALSEYCQDVFHLDQNKLVSKIKGLQAFLTNDAITLPYYYDKAMQHWVYRTVAAQHIEKIFVYSSSMAQYCESEDFSHCKRIIDFVDVDSDKWRQYADKKTGIAKWVYEREYKLLADYEDKICQLFDASLFVSEDEASLFRRRQHQTQQTKVHGVLNGVDVDFFDPAATFTSEPLVPDTPYLVFTGAMDYWANVDAVVWFVNHVWLQIYRKQPELQFLIVGGNPTDEIEALTNVPGVIVTGRVHDIRPFIANAACVVAPLRIARGIQNKVLEAMAMNKAIVMTTMAMEGINAPQSSWLKVTDSDEQFAEECLNLLVPNDVAEQENNNRQWIIDNFTWRQTLADLTNFFEVKAKDESETGDECA